MAHRHRLDNKYTAPKKGSLQEKIRLAEQSIEEEADSQRFKVSNLTFLFSMSDINRFNAKGFRFAQEARFGFALGGAL